MFYRAGRVCVAWFESGEAQALRQCMAELATLLSDDVDRADPAMRRLFPDVYPDDPVQAAEIRALIEDDLKKAKVRQVTAVLGDLVRSGGQVRLEDENAEVWLRALTDARLAVGTRIDIRDDTDLQGEIDEAVLRDPTSTRVRQLTFYAYLTLLQESLLGALTA